MSNLTGMPRGSGVDWTETADRVIELERRLQAQISEMCRQKQAAIEAIDRVEEARLREVLELYYLDGYTWEQVAERMTLDKRWVYRLHGKALMCVRVPPEFDH
jgi:DNA-directed RNA polymerase specialized sigma subunit